jgi:hypothetical protein
LAHEPRNYLQRHRCCNSDDPCMSRDMR